jgi:adenosylcobinamide-GDP ribazoletransferase
MTTDELLRAELRDLVEDLKASLAFLTRLPGTLYGGAAELPDFRRTARVFPAVGVIVAIAAGVVMTLAAASGMNPMLVACLGVATAILVTGGLHEDGLADTADGFGGGADVARRLEIMQDSRIGAHGATALVMSVLLRVMALAAIAADGSWRAVLALIAAEAVSRAAMVRLWHDLPAARADGLSVQSGTPDHHASLVALAIAGVIAIVTVIPALGLGPLLFAAFLSAAATYGFARLSLSAIGGRTGDTLGACQQVAGAAFLIGLAAFA